VGGRLGLSWVVVEVGGGYFMRWLGATRRECAIVGGGEGEEGEEGKEGRGREGGVRASLVAGGDGPTD
jgi:hypothetical protein